jgi:catechol 2,3-dioxygenase-like lactoylglutathione lyase family enzyme
MKLHAARLFVHDLSAARSFFVQKLGLSLAAGSVAAGYCVFDAGPAQLVVEAVQPDAADEDHALVGRFSGLSFSVPDIHAAFTELQALGVRFTSAPERQSWGGILATFADPADNQFQLVQVSGPANPSQGLPPAEA